VAIWQPPLEPVGAELGPEALPFVTGLPAGSATGALPVAEPPPFELDPRFEYGGSQSICAGAGSGEPQGGTAPSKLAGPAQMFETGCSCATHVHVDGQSVLVAHVIVLAWQDEVEPVVVVQEGGGNDPSTVPTTPTGPASTRIAGPEPVEGAPLVETPGPAEPLLEQEVMVSGTQVNPSPQSLSTLQGRSYVGTHDFTVVEVHAPASSAGAAQSAFFGQLGAGSGAAQFV